MYDGCGGIDVAPGVASIRAPRTGTGVTEVGEVGEVVGDAGGDLDLESVTLPLWGETVEEAAMIRLGDAFSLALDPGVRQHAALDALRPHLHEDGGGMTNAEVLEGTRPRWSVGCATSTSPSSRVRVPESISPSPAERPVRRPGRR
jgi:hypothetical protein